jgi:hypothetical protein
MNDMGGVSDKYGERRSANRVFVKGHEGSRARRRTSCTWDDNFIIDVEEVGWGGMNWIGLTQDMDR